MLKGKQRHGSKNVVVLGSETVKSSTNGLSPPRRNCLRNIVKSDIFRTGQKSGQVCESAALTAELRAPETEAYRAYPAHVQGGGHAFFFMVPPSVFSNANRAVLANARLGRVTF